MTDAAANARGEEPQDAALLAALAGAASRHEPLPAQLAAFAREAYTVRSLDAELAELLHDSALADEALAGVRGGGGVRSLEFEAPALRIEVSLEHDRTLVIQLVPPAAADVALRHLGGRVEARADALGRCVIDDAPAGPLSIRIRPDGSDAAVETAWTVL